MCGISGIYNFSGKSIDAKKILYKILKLQHDRGPDDKGIWTSKCEKISFGHNRLSIIDLSNKAKQPFVSNDKKFILTYNGEIYKFQRNQKRIN